jgi:CelD/BcsL family acetyltransferase involved in cellulose biosynthesis
MLSVDSQIPATAWPTTGAPPCLPPLTSAASAPSCEESLPRSAPLRVRRVAPAWIGTGTRAAEPFAPPEEIAALAGVWNLLAGSVPFRSFEWMESWWRHYQLPGWQSYLLTVEDAAGAIVGIAPWYLARSPIAGRVMQFMGSGEACSEYLTVLTRPGSEREIAAALSQWLSTEGAGDWDLLHLTAVLESDPAASALAEEFARRGHLIDQQPGMPCWQCELPATWDEFVRRLSKSRRERVRQLTRKYFDTGRVQTHWVATEAELDKAFAMFVDMHQRRRQSLGQPGCYASQRFAAFHRDVSHRLCAEGKLRLLWTELDGRPVGAEYDFIDDRTVYYYSTGVEPDATADNPGWLAMIGSLRRAIDEGCRSFDFLRGDEAYKCSWGAKSCATVETRIVGRRRLAGLRHAAWLGRQQFRRWAKQVRGWTTQRTKND